MSDTENYDFSQMHNRFHTNSMKWDVDSHELPMWVADMDFQTAPEIIRAIKKRADSGIYGYAVVPDDFFEAISNWWQRRHQFRIDPQWLLFCTGVVPAISSVVRKLTTVGEKVLIQAPVYNIFYNSITNNGRQIISSDLVLQGDRYKIDYADLESKLADPQTTMMLLCNPHNPVGRVWTWEELNCIAKLCCKHHVLVVSDEIHCDLTMPAHAYIPFASVSPQAAQNSVTCIAPTKAFNLAGLQTAAIFVPNQQIRHKVNRGINTDEVAEPNVFAIEAAIAAFTQGEAWLDALRTYLAKGRSIAEAFITEHIPQIHLLPGEATYLLWLDCRQLTEDTEDFCRQLRRETGLYISAGGSYGACANGFTRMNIACPHERIYDGLDRLKRGIDWWNSAI